ncbi:hypothetical protein BDQ17DRAFT_1436838 [Cyathus striatus]|nr:hypothetical protein BDQ17DRAFT_1436838 [Cyathus striatus]
MGQISFEKAYIISQYFEALAYGLFLCLFGVTLYLYFHPTYNRGKQDNHTLIMIGFSTILFFVATCHLTIDFYRLLHGYVDSPSGPAVYLRNFKTWHMIFKNILFGIQQALGSVVAMYRTWVLWSYNWKIIALPTILLAINIVAGCLICAAHTKVGSTFDVIVSNSLIPTYYSVAFILSVMTVGLMSYRIWIIHQNSSNYYVGEGRLLSIIWILIESAALQIITEFILLVSACAFSNYQHVVLEWVTPIVGITFNSVAVRVKLQSLREAGTQTHSTNNQVQTIGSMPLRRININVTKEIENDLGDSKRTSESSV